MPASRIGRFAPWKSVVYPLCTKGTQQVIQSRAIIPALLTVLCLAGPCGFAESPVNVPGCLLWLDAADTPGDGTHVAAWRDRSGHNGDAAQPDASHQPTSERSEPDALPMLRFDGQDVLVTPLKRDWSGTDWTLFVVAALDKDTPANYRGIIGNRFGEGRENWWSLGTGGDGATYLELAAGVGVTTKLSPANGKTCIYTAVKQGQHFALYRNGALMGEADHANVGGLSNELRIGLWCGAEQGWKGGIGGIILYDGAMGTVERDSLETHLAGRWGVFFPQQVMVKRPTW